MHPYLLNPTLSSIDATLPREDALAVADGEVDVNDTMAFGI